MRCEICGINYLENLAEDKRKHEKDHKKFLTLQEKFGKAYVMPYYQQKEIKAEAKCVFDKKLSLPVRLVGAEMIFRGWFSRSIKAGDKALHLKNM